MHTSRAYSTQDEVSIVALVDPVTATTEALRERQPALAGAATFTDHEEMLDAVQPDGVVISSPHALHHPHIIAALRAGGTRAGREADGQHRLTRRPRSSPRAMKRARS